jgi:hypothetical protein
MSFSGFIRKLCHAPSQWRSWRMMRRRVRPSYGCCGLDRVFLPDDADGAPSVRRMRITRQRFALQTGRGFCLIRWMCRVSAGWTGRPAAWNRPGLRLGFGLPGRVIYRRNLLLTKACGYPRRVCPSAGRRLARARLGLLRPSVLPMALGQLQRSLKEDVKVSGCSWFLW